MQEKFKKIQEKYKKGEAGKGCQNCNKNTREIQQKYNKNTRKVLKNIRKVQQKYNKYTRKF